MEEKINKKKGFSSIIKEMKEFYIKELKTKHMWNFVVSIFIYLAMVISFKTGALSIQKIYDMALKNVQTDIYESVADIYEQESESYISYEDIARENENVSISRLEALKQQLALSAVTIISGVAPFINIPVIVTLVYPITYAANISSGSILMVVLMSVMAIIELMFITLIVAVGMYFCKMSTKHFRYNESSSFTINDVKLQFNEAMKRNEKVEEIKKQMDEKYEKIKALNEKTNYKMIICFGVFATILLEICTLITGV